MIEDGSIDFAFSFDSLVHAEADVMSSYANELARVLKPGGCAFLHHSNLDAVRSRSVLDKVKQRLSRLPFDQRWRAPSMSAEKMRAFVEAAGMTCIQQEIVPLGSRLAVDDRLHEYDRQNTSQSMPGCQQIRDSWKRQRQSNVSPPLHSNEASSDPSCDAPNHFALEKSKDYTDSGEVQEKSQKRAKSYRKREAHRKKNRRRSRLQWTASWTRFVIRRCSGSSSHSSGCCGRSSLR